MDDQIQTKPETPEGFNFQLEDGTVMMTITEEGKFIPGPGLSNDEATQATANMLALMLDNVWSTRVQQYKQEIQLLRGLCEENGIKLPENVPTDVPVPPTEVGDVSEEWAIPQPRQYSLDPEKVMNAGATMDFLRALAPVITVAPGTNLEETFGRAAKYLKEITPSE